MSYSTTALTSTVGSAWTVTPRPAEANVFPTRVVGLLVAELVPAGARADLRGNNFRMMSSIKGRHEVEGEYPSHSKSIGDVLGRIQPHATASRVKGTDWTAAQPIREHVRKDAEELEYATELQRIQYFPAKCRIA